MAKPKVLIINDITTDTPAYAKFAEKFECVRYYPTTKEQFAIDMQKPEYADTVAIWAMWFGFVEFGPALDDEVYDAFPKGLKVIAISPVGYDRYSVPKLTERGIILTNNPGLGASAVADIALYLIISTFRYTSLFEHALRREEHVFFARRSVDSDRFVEGAPARPEAVDSYAFGNNVGGRLVTTPRHKRMGAIGKEVAGRAKAIGMDVHYYTRTPLSDAALASLPAMTAHATIDELLPNCDVIVLSVPHSAATHHLLNAKTLALLPRGARVVNVGRGPLLDTQALVDALNAGQLSAAGLDVYEGEPNIHAGLLNRWDVTLLPHLGSATHDTVIEAEERIMANIENVVLDGGPGLTPVSA